MIIRWFRSWLRKFTTSQPTAIRLDLSRRQFLIGASAAAVMIATPLLNHMPLQPEPVKSLGTSSDWQKIGQYFGTRLMETANREGFMRRLLVTQVTA